MWNCCLNCVHLEHRPNYVYPYRCLLNKAERFSAEELGDRVFFSDECPKYKSNFRFVEMLVDEGAFDVRQSEIKG